MKFYGKFAIFSSFRWIFLEEKKNEKKKSKNNKFFTFYAICDWFLVWGEYFFSFPQSPFLRATVLFPPIFFSLILFSIPLKVSHLTTTFSREIFGKSQKMGRDWEKKKHGIQTLFFLIEWIFILIFTEMHLNIVSPWTTNRTRVCLAMFYLHKIISNRLQRRTVICVQHTLLWNQMERNQDIANIRDVCFLFCFGITRDSP